MSMSVKDQVKERFDASDKWLAPKRPKWDEYESIFNVVLSDSISGQAKSQVFDPKLPTMTLDRESRVMAQLPTGKVKAVSKNDEGASKLMNLTLDRYILPNANAQFPFLIKNRLVDRYSNIYGNFFVFVDWDVRDDGYIGPDMWLIPIRDIFPQVGAMSVDDSDYAIIRTWRKLSFFENPPKEGLSKEAKDIYDILKDKSGEKSGRSRDQMSEREQDEFAKADAPTKDGFYQVWSMYEKDRWVDYVPAADRLWRDGDNPHDNDELPIVNKYSIPLLDDFMALGDYERGKTMQYGLNSLWNLSLDTFKYTLFPPMLLNKDAIVASTAKWGPAAKWFFRGLNTSASNVAQPVNVNPGAMGTFNSLYGVMNASLLNQFGTTDTTVSQNVDPGFGKTPEALKMSQNRENARDNTDRFYMEQFLVQVYKKFINLTSKKMKSNLQIRLFNDEIKDIASKYKDVADMYDEKTGKLTLSSKQIGDIVYDYEIVPGSTYQVDQQKQMDNMLSFLQFYAQNAQLVDQKLFNEHEAKGISMSELITRIFASTGTSDWDKIIVDKTKEKTVAENQKKLMNVMQGIAGGVGGQGGIPAQPNLMGQPQQQDQSQVPDQMNGQQQPGSSGIPGL